jgi:hypothetical protein
MQHILNVLTPAASNALVSLDELKTLLSIAPTDTSKDAKLQLAIDGVSAEMATKVNRVFGLEEVEETFYDIAGCKRLYFSRWPVKLSDISVMTLDGNDILTDTSWVLEEKKGFMYTPADGSWTGTLNTIYKGGYVLPDNVPLDLKRIASVLSGETYYAIERGLMLSGVKMIVHKQARISFYPTGGGSGTGGGNAPTGMGTPASWAAAKNILEHYFRHWV